MIEATKWVACPLLLLCCYIVIHFVAPTTVIRLTSSISVNLRTNLSHQMPLDSINGSNPKWMFNPHWTKNQDPRYHSPCFSARCSHAAPSASMTGRTDSHFAMEGSKGFIVFDLQKCHLVLRLWIGGSMPCDMADVHECVVEAGDRLAGPWDAIGFVNASCPGSTSQYFSRETRYIRLTVLSNNGYTGGTRLADVQLYAVPNCWDHPLRY
eukprot:NODE_4867_length_730_cov_5.142620_g4704_i0.p1 GENE.NODE_4867_length_730_cov_5.142620_g4704_i0~~NODE_4867_length_730_cov_5.142620_g4704_i0.p1  ORF type:complete len:210 (+),score=8.42 NODE_4867_length_730_cov_5.142620_g4704_i0:29-658(+)